MSHLDRSQFRTSFDQYFQISRGVIPGFSAFGTGGVNRDIDTSTTPEDIWSGGGLFPYQTTAQTLAITSDSENDNAAGTGVRSVVIIGLDANWNSITEVVPTAGSTPVVTSNSFLRVNAFRSVTCGSAGTNVGTISLNVSGGGGAMQGQINPGEGQSMRALFSVPAGFTAYLLDAFVGIIRAGTNEYAEIAIIARTNLGPWITRNYLSVSANGGSSFNISPRIIGALAEKSDLRFTATNVSANNTICQATFIAVLKSNTLP